LGIRPASNSFCASNGPGTARLFEELSLGTNFTSIDQAEPGDFLKIFWNDQIGLRKFGHSVVYLGRGVNSEGVETLKYWSANKKGGYGRTEVPTSKIERTLFSHLSDPAQINRVFHIPETESYLASMLITISTPEKMDEMVGITAWTAGNSIPASNIGTKVKAKEKNSKTGPK
jgi:hypothetical protein